MPSDEEVRDTVKTKAKAKKAAAKRKSPSVLVSYLVLTSSFVEKRASQRREAQENQRRVVDDMANEFSQSSDNFDYYQRKGADFSSSSDDESDPIREFTPGEAQNSSDEEGSFVRIDGQPGDVSGQEGDDEEGDGDKGSQHDGKFILVFVLGITNLYS